MEIWKSVEGYEGLYEVSNYGRVKSLPRHRVAPRGGKYQTPEVILSPLLNKGYEYVSLHKDRRGQMKKVHRLVAQAFVSNPNNYPVVNHKDFNPRNNNADNLEWVTQKENIRYSANRMNVQHKCKTKTGERYISMVGKRYLVCITKHRVHKLFDSFEDAIIYRNERLKQYDYTI